MAARRAHVKPRAASALVSERHLIVRADSRRLPPGRSLRRKPDHSPRSPHIVPLAAGQPKLKSRRHEDEAGASILARVEIRPSCPGTGSQSRLTSAATEGSPFKARS
jgi:hypothetical protein